MPVSSCLTDDLKGHGDDCDIDHHPAGPLSRSGCHRISRLDAALIQSVRQLD
jgi:hypothetical protein